jgi:hypothetical protein
MEPGRSEDDIGNIHSKVLQATLSEIASRPKALAATSDGATTDTIKADDAGWCCVICLDVVSDPCVAVPCSHRNFDFLCLVSWLNCSPSCPLCKADIVQVLYGGDPLSPSPSYSTYNVPRGTSSNEAQSARQPRAGLISNGIAQPPRRRRRPDPPATAVERDQERTLARRRRIYELKLYSLHVGTNRITRYTDLTPQMFDTDPALVPRARMWIRRELRVFDFLCAPSAEDGGASGGTGRAGRSARQLSSNAEFLLEYVIAILRTMDIKGSRGQAEEMLQEFLGRENTRLFLHELRAWLRSPYTTLEAWDAHVQYDEARVTPAARIPRQPDDSTSHEENEQQRMPPLYPDVYRAPGAVRPGGSRAGASSDRRSRWSPYATRTPSSADRSSSRR